ncbi:serine/threonine-protein kinase EDR1-like isoform X1 [Lycium ferocissimum]|uniref:serine/threonine-protein kinase EDR1-like isoform X1 n=1 Tax=Lycium ferocissimum TaxID=112874 RepID=UPI0028154F54|nr:serine/threonine-protein kinase EDR1-like isoform X1 [Lycium ferocissimum]XP_059290675.1 serine/threonine-protein kinase EDR1-like isoform X1 [Lycium ferocissimum]
MEKTGNDTGPASLPPDSPWWPADISKKLQQITLVSSEDKTNSTVLSSKQEPEGLASKRASQILWDTGELAEPIPDGFYFVIPERRFKEHFDTIPSLDDLYALETEGLRPNVILVNLHKDKKLSMLKQLTLTLVKGLSSTPAVAVKKIAGLVCDFYKHPKYKSTHVSGTLEEVSHALGSQGIHMLCQMKDGSCHSRAILFKVLADTVGLECKLIVGLPRGAALECTDSSKHIHVTVILDSIELLVDLMHYPGKLFPYSTKQLHRSHFFGESDSVETDSCNSPMDPISPTCFSSDYSGTGSPEHPFFRGPGRSILGGRAHSFKDCSYDVTSSRSAGASPIHTRRRRRRSISMIPEIGDDIVRVVREMNASMKRNHLSGEQATFDLSTRKREDNSDHQVLNYRPDDLNTGNGEKGQAPHFHRKCLTSDKAISLPSSPRWSYGRGKAGGIFGSPDMTSRLDKVIESSRILNKPLLPFDEWNIDFSEITIGARVGIGFFGEVFRCSWNGTEVAVKVFLEQDLTEENIEDFANEISILSRIRHPNVILFLGACTTPPRLSVVTEFMEMGSLYHLIHVSGQKNNLSWQRRLKMLCDICRGLMCIHRMKIVHRDIKSGNCLVNKHYKVKICDFGLSRSLTPTPVQDSSSAGTPEWMAPELIRNEPFTEKCDIFSLGVIIWELYTLKKPWEGVPPLQVVYAVANDGKRLEIPEGPLGKLIADCWAEPDERPSCEEILSRLGECRSSAN